VAEYGRDVWTLAPASRSLPDEPGVRPTFTAPSPPIGGLVCIFFPSTFPLTFPSIHPFGIASGIASGIAPRVSRR